MPIPPGTLGNLTAEQEAKLRDLWVLTLKTFGVVDADHARRTSLQLPREDAVPASPDPHGTKKAKGRSGLFGLRHSGASTPTNDPSKGGDDDDKYGQMKEYHEIMATRTPESLRQTFWSMVKADHPDALLLRFLRARKWNVEKALVMMISTMNWRGFEQHVDDDVMIAGDGGALADSNSANASAKREGHDFLQQLRMGKSYLHGIDKEGRPICIVHARLHRSGEQTEKSMERYTVYVIETCRLALKPPVETSTVVFDMTGFTMANMDYAPVKFMIKVFEANYPESLGAVLVHKAPWIFQGIWKIIKGWLDPVVAGKVHFTSNVEDLEAFIPKSQIIKGLGGGENWEYKYIEPISGEDERLKDTATRQKLETERAAEVEEYQKKTFDWISAGSVGDSTKIKAERDALSRKLWSNYWQLDPYIRARTYYDRTGMIQEGGKVEFYPDSKAAPSLPVNGGPRPSIPALHAGADDVD